MPILGKSTQIRDYPESVGRVSSREMMGVLLGHLLRIDAFLMTAFTLLCPDIYKCS